MDQRLDATEEFHLSLFGYGGMSDVMFMAFPNQGFTGILKVARDPGYNGPIVNEAKILHAIHEQTGEVCKGLPRPYWYTNGNTDERAQVCFFYFSGTPLATAYTQNMGVCEVAAMGVDIADAFEYVHGCQYVHGDVKPDNILLPFNRGPAILSDFGLATKKNQDTSLEQTTTLFGTVEYMAPEQARCEPIDFRADYFSLALVVREGLLREKLVTKGDFREIVHKRIRYNKLDRLRIHEEIRLQYGQNLADAVALAAHENKEARRIVPLQIELSLLCAD